MSLFKEMTISELLSWNFKRKWYKLDIFYLKKQMINFSKNLSLKE